MQFAAVLNKDGGTLRTTDLDAFSEQVRETLIGAGHGVDISIVAGSELEMALAEAATGRADVVLAGGGDGTVSAAAAKLMNKDKALAILPAGTMNLFARGLGIPLTLDEAVAAFGKGDIRQVDVATANGRPFVHQFSVGLHAKMVQLRDQMDFNSKVGKIRASAKAAISTVLHPPAMKVKMTIGEAEVLVRTTSVGVTNNLFGEGHLPYADVPDDGVLGIYITVAEHRTELVRLMFNMARGKWRDNDQVEIHQAERATLSVLSRTTRLRAAIDGELCKLDRETEFRIHPGALRVLVPASDAKAKAA